MSKKLTADDISYANLLRDNLKSLGEDGLIDIIIDNLSQSRIETILADELGIYINEK